MTASSPYDVQAFRLSDPAFPHHSTVDQLYTDQKFEAYRKLGAHVGRKALAEADGDCRTAILSRRRYRESHPRDSGEIADAATYS